MYPANQYMDPYYSYCRDHAPYPYYPSLGPEAGHPRMAMDSSCRPPTYGPWPYSGSTSHLRPPDFHSCCNHTYPPGYYSFRPPFPQELPPHLYYHGPIQHQPNAYPSYFVPPTPYPVDQTPYGYERFKSHCCGCPNHVCHGGEKSNLKIEEEIPEVKPEREQKGADNSSIVRHPNYQYPVMWLPPSNMKDMANGRSFELSPQLFNKWFPESGERTRDVKQQNHDNQKTKQFKWPIVWMPAGYDEPKQGAKELKENDESRKITEENSPSPEIKIVPFSWFENGLHDQKPAAKDGSGEHNERSSVMDKSSGTEHRHDTTVDGNLKTVPVVPKKPNNENKPVEQTYKVIPVVADKEGDEKKVHTCRTIPVMAQKESDESKSDLVEKKEENKASNVAKEGENAKRNDVESSKGKHSKLPPVCLRVDPLPRKKSGNASRSSRTPIRKDVDKDKRDVKETQSQNKVTKLTDPDVSEVRLKSPDETDKRLGSTNVTVQDASVKHTQEEQIPTSMVDQKMQPCVNVEVQENAGMKTLQECDISTKEDEMKMQDGAAKFARRREINLSEPDAAVRIQCAYRGYHVRRWQPLEKLRKIKNVYEQMEHVKKQLQSFEDSSKQLTVKEQVAVNETIMNLLLKLDTIQGLHPTVRDVRKSVARELVCLQEKLDSLCKQLSGEPNHSKSEGEKTERIHNPIETTVISVLTGEPSEEEKFAGVSEGERPSSITSKEMMHAEVPSADYTEQKHQMEGPSITKEEAHGEGKAATPGECQGSSWMDVMRDTGCLGHPTEQKHQIEESNTSRREVWPEGKAAAKGEGQEVSPADYVESLHDAALSEGVSELKQCPVSTEDKSHAAESNTGVSPAIEDSTAPMATSSMESAVAVNDGSVEGQVRESAAVESLALEHDVAPVEEYLCTEPSAPSVHLEDSSKSVKDAEAHDNGSALAYDFMVFNPGDQPEEDMDANMQKVADTRQDSAKKPDGTPKPPVGDTDNMNYVTAANAENSSESPLLEETSWPDSVLEQAVSEESEATKRYEVSCKDESALVDQENASNVQNPTGSCTMGEEPLAVPLENNCETVENNPTVAGHPIKIVAGPTLPESGSGELPCELDGTGVHESADLKVSSDSQSGTQECADGGKTIGGMKASEAAECHEMLEEAPACAAGADSAELEHDNTMGDPGVETASKEATSVPAAIHDVPKNDDEKKMAEENQKLKEMLQKLLASGNDQMGVITELSEKVKTLERKLARKKKPKVRVHRPVRNTTAKAY